MSFLVKTTVIFLTLNAAAANSVFNFKNNACLTTDAYLFQFLSSNKQCYHTEDVALKMPERIKSFVGKYGEIHTVTTKDGYILNTFRLRHPKPKGVILFNPPFTTDSKIWLSQGNESVAYVYWQQGYDVWLSNHRGTDNSPEHVTLKKSDRLYWDFTFHEIGVYDLKSVIDDIYGKTGTKMVMIGHSMSTTTSFIYASIYPEDAAKKVTLIVAPAAVAYLQSMKGSVAGFVSSYKIVYFLSKTTGYLSFLGQRNLVTKISQFVYKWLPIKKMLPILFAASSGPTVAEFDPRILGIFFSFLSEQAIKNIYHFGQLKATGRFAMVDYGLRRNQRLYGQVISPEYPLEKIQVPIYVLASTDDYVCQLKDVYLFYERLQPMAKVYGIKVISGLNHFDHHVGLHRWEKAWNPILDLIETVSYQEQN